MCPSAVGADRRRSATPGGANADARRLGGGLGRVYALRPDRASDKRSLVISWLSFAGRGA
jgi:hypothetical protein